MQGHSRSNGRPSKRISFFNFWVFLVCMKFEKFSSFVVVLASLVTQHLQQFHPAFIPIRERAKAQTNSKAQPPPLSYLISVVLSPHSVSFSNVVETFNWIWKWKGQLSVSMCFWICHGAGWLPFPKRLAQHRTGCSSTLEFLLMMGAPQTLAGGDTEGQ